MSISVKIKWERLKIYRIVCKSVQNRASWLYNIGIYLRNILFEQYWHLLRFDLKIHLKLTKFCWLKSFYIINSKYSKVFLIIVYLFQILNYIYNHPFNKLYLVKDLQHTYYKHNRNLTVTLNFFKLILPPNTQSKQQFQHYEVDHSIEVFRLKKLFHRLQTARISGSVVTIIIPPRKNVAEITKLLTDEQSKASSIKDKSNKNAVIEAQNSARQRLKMYQKAPDNGLVVLCGKIMDENSTSEKKLICDFEPFKPINLSIYYCDSKFYLDELKKELLITEPPFGFIIVDGSGALYATLQGNARQILNKFTVELPKKHNKGGQSSVRFARLREEKRHNYLRKVCEVAVTTFITDNRCNVTGLVLAGSADFKNDLNRTDMFDPRLQTKVVNIVDVSYGFENGLNQAIEKSAQALLNVKFIKQKKLISSFFDHIALGDGMVIYGVQDTMKLIESGGVGLIVCFEDLDYLRLKLKNSETGAISTIYTKPQNATNADLFKDKETGAVLQSVEEQTEPTSLPEWLSVHYKDYGCDIEFVTDKSPEGTQFLKGFSGLGGFLRYKIEFEHLLSEAQEYEEEEDDFI